MSQVTYDALVLIASTQSDHEQSRLINDFIASRQGQYERMARRACHRYKRSVDHYDDVASIITEHAWQLVNHLVSDPESLERDSRNFDYVLSKRISDAVEAYMCSELGGAAASGMSNVIRRAAQAEKTRNIMRLRELREPTDAEIIEETNKRLSEDRKDPAKQGILITEDDLFHHGHAYEIDPELVEHSVFAPQDDFILLPFEGKKLVMAILEAVRATGDRKLISVGEVWIASLIDESVGEKSQRDICEITGLKRSDVSRRVSAIKRLARKVVEAHLDPEDCR